MRRLILLAGLVLLIPARINTKQNPPDGKPGCGGARDQISYFYEESVLEQLQPPDWRRSLIRIAVGREKKLNLWTDGETFRLWTTNITLPQADELLLALAQTGRLPLEPADAASQLKIKWESAPLSANQFAQLHQALNMALSKYVSSAQERYRPMLETRLTVTYLDTVSHRISYENGYERILVEVANDQSQNKAMLDWVRSLEKLAEEKFHRSFSAE